MCDWPSPCLRLRPINDNLHCYSVFAGNRNCVLCENVVKDEEYFLFTCPLYADIRVKRLDDTSQNATTASLLNVLAWKNKTNMLRLAKFVFSAMKRREEFTGSGNSVLRLVPDLLCSRTPTPSCNSDTFCAAV